ncbi:MAG TPA: hypothetical protein VM370_09800 [Candidatus Thermoplasmatota archaeon]|nr:hypothetical protein [Candidatus Thermoplasmatota archaeon]
MLRRVLALALFPALALVPVVAHAGLYAPAEDVLMSHEGSFMEEPVDLAATCPGGYSVGAAAHDIVPGDLQPDGSWKMWMEPFEDTNGNGVYDAYDPLTAADGEVGMDEPFTDENGNGKWDAPFMAGYGHEKDGNEYYVASGVHDLVWARALAITCGDVTLGLVAVDTVGLFRDFVLGVRSAAPSEYDHVIVSSTHTHDSFDTMGLWGAHQLSDGKHPRAMAHIHEQMLAALTDALAAREPVGSVKLASAHTMDAIPYAGSIQTDLRDPFVLDDKVVALQFAAPDGAAIATLVNWAPHPETLAGTKSELSSDYAHYLRQRIESRFGGTAVYVSGAVGGMMTTLGAKPKYPDGSFVPDHSYEKARVIGETAADLVADALDAGPSSAADGLALKTRLFNVPADNAFLLALNSLGVLDHSTALGFTELPSTGEPGVVAPAPFLRAETDVLTLFAGDEKLLQALTVPGELLPEVAYGNPLKHDAEVDVNSCFAYNPVKSLFNDGRNGKVDPATGVKTPGWERVEASNPAYPKEPAFARMTTARQTMLLGLTNDELGYMVPADDFVPAQIAPEVFSDGVDRCGDNDHYEETNSASSMLAMSVAVNLAEMLDPSYVRPQMPSEEAGLLASGDGVWLDTSRSGGYEREEDARIQVPGIPEGAPACFGFLNGSNEDIGQEPSEDARGLWVDIDGDCAFGPRDGVVFADMWATSEGEPHWRPS